MGELAMAASALRLGLVLMVVPVGAIVLVGLFTSLFQAVTQLQDSSLAFLPKLVAAAVVLWLASPWMLTLLAQYTTRLWTGGGG
ncbi:MAG: flagellar biosynthetic protein FliQ [Actinomycetia bacterium]|nr:flagellar biosynthetic protein FliQ [Actinomycetes bacterium]